ncbi:hypothetical protein [Apilactobacillus ozensis]|uniref:hypothetical protein n=1 Tax=Apilactobacillus ozensis TaxID=866801 RepID=UPI0006D270E1|nr:hypothetical protein [Apilactobacillus ozensis]
MLNLDNRSATFINAYEKAYKQAISKLLPGYIYNRRAIYTHSKADSNKNSQVSKYDKKSRVHAKVFKVIGYKFNKAGNLYYKLSNGNYVAADNSIANLYYTKLGVSKKYKVISKKWN